MVGAAAAAVLVGAGARRNQDNPGLIKASIRLPIETLYYVCQWDARQPYDADKDIRNNMLGADHAELIIKIDAMVNLYIKHGRDPVRRAEYLEELKDEFPDANKSSLEWEFDLTAAAPISANFPPPANAIPLLPRKG